MSKNQAEIDRFRVMSIGNSDYFIQVRNKYIPFLWKTHFELVGYDYLKILYFETAEEAWDYIQTYLVCFYA